MDHEDMRAELENTIAELQCKLRGAEAKMEALALEIQSGLEVIEAQTVDVTKLRDQAINTAGFHDVYAENEKIEALALELAETKKAKDL